MAENEIKTNIQEEVSIQVFLTKLIKGPNVGT